MPFARRSTESDSRKFSGEDNVVEEIGHQEKKQEQEETSFDSDEQNNANAESRGIIDRAKSSPIVSKKIVGSQDKAFQFPNSIQDTKGSPDRARRPEENKMTKFVNRKPISGSSKGQQQDLMPKHANSGRQSPAPRRGIDLGKLITLYSLFPGENFDSLKKCLLYSDLSLYILKVNVLKSEELDATDRLVRAVVSEFVEEWTLKINGDPYFVSLCDVVWHDQDDMVSLVVDNLEAISIKVLSNLSGTAGLLRELQLYDDWRACFRVADMPATFLLPYREVFPRNFAYIRAL